MQSAAAPSPGTGNSTKKKIHRDHACKPPQDGADANTEAPSPHSKGRGAGAAKSRRQLARGPRSGELVIPASGSVNGDPPSTSGVLLSSLPPSPSSSSSEDHRVVSTHFHDGATQAVLKVTMLAAGFVIGARGISARLIGQVTGAVVHSWTERSASVCRPPSPGSSPSPPVRLFRIEGKRSSVQAAVALIQEAVSKYKELCECKRRGEFVQREHLIGGVEFYYHPPPRKALIASQLPSPMRKLSPSLPPSNPPSCPPSSVSSISRNPLHPHAWNTIPPRPASQPPPSPPQCSSTQPFLLNWRLQPPSPPPLPESLIPKGSAPPLPPPHLLPSFRLAPPLPVPAQLHGGGNGSSSSSMASIEQSLQRVRLEGNQPLSTQQNKGKLITELIPPSKLHYNSGQKIQQQQRQEVQQYCSLFSVFGNGGHPVPIAQAAADAEGAGEASGSRRKMTEKTGPPIHGSGTQASLQAASTAFEFTACDFLRQSLPWAVLGAGGDRLQGAAATSTAAVRPSLCMPPQPQPQPPPSPSPSPPEYRLFGQQKPNAGTLLMPPPAQFNGDLSQWPPLMRSRREPSHSKGSGC